MGAAAEGPKAISPWHVDASSLRTTLDGIRAGLQRSVTVLPAADALVHDKAAVATSLRAIFSRLDAVDLIAVQATSDLVREFQPKHQIDQLRALLEQLRVAFRRHVLRTLGEKKLAAAKRLLNSPAPDVLRILGREDDENSHSDLIAWLLNPRHAPVVAPPVLHGLVEKLELPAEWVARIDRTVSKHLISVRREVVFAKEFSGADDLRRVDIVVSGPDFMLVIENKVWSSEHTDQTSAYWTWLEPMRCLRGGLLLSPSGMPAACSDFKAVSYLELISLLLDGPAENALTAAEEIVLGSYLKTLARNILPVEMRAVREAATMVEAG